MLQRSELLERERQKLAWLQAKVKEQALRVHTIEQIKDDPLDEMFERENNGSARVQASALDGSAIAAPGPATVEMTGRAPLVQSGAALFQWVRKARRVPANWVAVLRFLGREGKTFREVEAFLVRENVAMTPGAARTGLMNYRKDFGFVENPRKGFYKATEQALGAIRAQEEESPATGNSGASESQPDPLARAAA